MKEYLEKDEENLLLDLFHIYAPTNGEAALSVFLAKFLEANKIDFVMDQFNNIYSMKYPGEPILSAHQDCVGDAVCGSLVKFINLYDIGGERILKGNGNIGADDKAGIFLILLYMLKVNPKINFVFSTGEEKSVATGIKTIVQNIKETDAFKKAPYCIVLDRKNSGDIICEKNNFGSKKFDEALEEIGKKYYYSSVRGGMSDTETFSNYMNAANLSVGYYNPHSKTEYLSINELLNTFDYLCDIVENLPRDIPYEEKKTYTYGGGGSYGGSYGGTYDHTYGNSYGGNYYGTKGYQDPKTKKSKYSNVDDDYDSMYYGGY